MSTAAIPFPPVLREGDRLTAEEFLRRWEAMPELKHAELLDGIVFLMASPVSDIHCFAHGDLNGWLWFYAQKTPGCRAGSDGTWIMGPDSVPQPDITMRILPQYGGQSTTAGKYAAGAPELIVEVSGSSSSRDLGVKLELYRKAGVREYLSILLKPQKVIWRQLVRGRYKEIALGQDGLLRSTVFPGLWLDPEAVWSPGIGLLDAAQRGIESPEHAAFVKELKKQ